MPQEGEGWAHRWNRRAAVGLAYIAAGVLAMLAVVTFADVVARYGFNRPFSFTVEVTELAMGLIVYLGVGLTTHEKGHVSVDVLTLRASNRGRATLEVVTGLLALGFLALMIWQLWLRAAALLAAGDQTQVWAIPLWPVAFAMAAAAALLFTGVAVHTVTALARLAQR